MRGKGIPTVPTLDNLFGTHINNVGKALSKATQRHSLLSANLANVNTPGYKRRDADFSIALDDAMKKPSLLSKWREDKQLQKGQGGSLRLDGNNVDLEKEVMAIAETELRYQALSDMAAG